MLLGVDVLLQLLFCCLRTLTLFCNSCCTTLFDGVDILLQLLFCVLGTLLLGLDVRLQLLFCGLGTLLLLGNCLLVWGHLVKECLHFLTGLRKSVGCIHNS